MFLWTCYDFRDPGHFFQKRMSNEQGGGRSYSHKIGDKLINLKSQRLVKLDNHLITQDTRVPFSKRKATLSRSLFNKGEGTGRIC